MRGEGGKASGVRLQTKKTEGDRNQEEGGAAILQGALKSFSQIIGACSRDNSD